MLQRDGRGPGTGRLVIRAGCSPGIAGKAARPGAVFQHRKENAVVETIITPQLRRQFGKLTAGLARDMCCTRYLHRFIDMPEGEYFWLEASLDQFSDGLGFPVRVRLWRREDRASWWDKDARKNRPLYISLVPYLRQLGCKPGEPRTIYVCLWYQENERYKR